MKIVGLVPAKNEGRRILYCLQSLAKVVDEIVYLDDGSTDCTLDLVKSVSKECRVTRIILRSGERNEGRDRNLLLNAGRSVNGDRFLVLDADEAFAADSTQLVRNTLESLKPGEVLATPWIHLWRSSTRYRVDPSTFVDNWRCVAFRDDGLAQYPDNYLHVSRTPISGKIVRLDERAKFLHFQFVCWKNVVIKQTWYKFLERLRTGQSVEELNLKYSAALDESGLCTAPSRPEWFFPFFNEADFMEIYHWRVHAMHAWKAAHGNLFDGLGECTDID